MESPRLAIVASHPIQYYAPWFRYLAGTGRLTLKVFYLWDGGVRDRLDPGFGQSIRWDVPLLDGYTHEFVPNTSSRPGTSSFFGLRNPLLSDRLAAFNPHAAMLIGYNHLSFLRQIFSRWPQQPPFPLIFRGDSHRLVPRPESLREAVRRWTIAAVYRRFAATLFVGKANLDYFKWHGITDDRLFFAPHAVDNDRFTGAMEETEREASNWRASLGVPRDHALVMFAGKFEDKKCPLDLLAAFSRLRLSNVSLIFVGAGRLQEELLCRATALDNVHFAPFQNQSQMPRAYAAADVFVLPSYGRSETWGLAINEALCMARPVIVSNHVGCAADLVEHGRNGLIFQAGDVNALADALHEALSDRRRLTLWGAEGRQIVERYNYTQASRGLFEAMAAIDAGPRSP